MTGAAHDRRVPHLPRAAVAAGATGLGARPGQGPQGHRLPVGPGQAAARHPRGQPGLGRARPDRRGQGAAPPDHPLPRGGGQPRGRGAAPVPLHRVPRRPRRRPPLRLGRARPSVTTERLTEPPVPRTGGQVLADQLRLHGTRAVYCVPGESYLGLLDALVDLRGAVDVVACRQEGGAAVMAEAHGKLTGRAGGCALTRGPGAPNASIGPHAAMQDSSPMLLLVGQVARGHLGREAFQELDLGAVFGTMAKWVATVSDPARLPELVARAFTIALSGRPGPVVLGLPEDVLTETVTVADAAPAVPAQAAPGPDELARLRGLLAAAGRPLVIGGGPGGTERACDALFAGATASSLPVAVSFRSQDVVDNTAAAYIGHLGTG